MCKKKQDVYDLLAQIWRHTNREKIRLITLRGLKSHTDAPWSQQLFSPLLFQSKVTFSQLEWLQGCNGLAIITITEKSSGISRIIWNVPLNNLKQVVEGGRRENLLQTDRRERHTWTCKTISEKRATCLQPWPGTLQFGSSQRPLFDSLSPSSPRTCPPPRTALTA